MKRILIIDDETKIRKMYKYLLTKEGYEVLDAKDAFQATRQLIAAQSVDLVLLDINIPEIDGVFVRGIIQEYDPRMKIIVSSVYPIDEQKNAIPDAQDYFDKAQGVAVLLEKVKSTLERI